MTVADAYNVLTYTVYNISNSYNIKSYTTLYNSGILNVFLHSSNYKILLVKFVPDYGKKKFVAPCS